MSDISEHKVLIKSSLKKMSNLYILHFFYTCQCISQFSPHQYQIADKFTNTGLMSQTRTKQEQEKNETAILHY